MSINFSLLKYCNPIFTETGMGEGDGVKKALRSRFKKIYSIELSAKRYEGCSIRFKREIQRGQAELLLGDSAERLDSILRRINP